MINKILSVNNLIKKVWIVLAILIVVAAVFSSIFRSLTPWAKQYKSEIEHHLTVLVDRPVTIQSMETGWYWFQPVLKLKNISINEGKEDALHLDQLVVGINLFKSLWYWRIQPGVLYIDTVHLVLREKSGRWRIDGLSTDLMANNQMTPEKTEPILGWLFQQERLVIKHFSAHAHLSDGGLIPISDLNLTVINRGGRYKLRGDARLDQTNSTVFQLLGDVWFDPGNIKHTKGQFYFSAKHINPAQWQRFIPKLTEHLESGQGDVELWLDLNKGALSAVQSHVKLKRLAWRSHNKNKNQILQSFYANLAWKINNKGWQLQGDHIQLRVGGVNWPENQLLIIFTEAENNYQLFIKSIVMESLFSDIIQWPSSFQTVLQAKPQGMLSDTLMFIKEKEITYFLTRFDRLSWLPVQKIPQIKNLSGVLNWQPDQGRLELDSENTSVTLKGHPTQVLALLNGAFDWKELSHGLRVSVERLVLSKPDLTVSAEGAIDQITTQSLGNIRFNVDFSGKNIKQWATFLPRDFLKPKLYEWLTQDITRVANASGKIKINGLAQDFPFDEKNGEFSILSHVNGVDLSITPQWQLMTDLEAYIRVKNRNLDIDIVNGNIQGVPVDRMNLRIDDIGKDKETLLIHGIVDGNAQKIINFVLASPLQKKLAALKTLAFRGMVLLNLRLEIPLYPENEENLVQGQLTFENNTVTMKHPAGTLKLDNVKGDLTFDENGIVQSALVASAFGYPLTVNMQSVKVPKSATLVSIDGECTIEALKKQFTLPALSLLNGMFSLNAQFKLTDDPDDLDKVVITSDLQGLAINLPRPLGKRFNTKESFNATLDFNLQKAMRLRANYNGHLSADILLHSQKGVLEFTSGQVQLGNALAIHQEKPGLELVGSLAGFDLQEWKKVYDKFDTINSQSSLFNHLKYINVTLGKLSVFKQQFDNMVVKAKTLPNKDWYVSLHQKKIAADLTYQQATNSLSGFIKYLHLSPLEKLSRDSESSPKVTPDQIPNLNLRIDNLSVGTKQIGNVTLKSHSSTAQCLIDYCKVDSPFYQLMLNGEWNKNASIEQSKVLVNVQFKDLAKNLALWQVTPAVDAGKGDMVFKGGWHGAFYDFSLASLNGLMYLQLKDGRITHLSPETEEKLGLGKLLSILSLQTIPRRLKLDFSDLSHQGYSFDIFKGDFNIKNGIMNTQNSYIDGPVAYASMKGNLDLVRRMYDLDLRVAPHITASLPVVATIAGGPIAGLAAWIANKIINQSMQKITGYSYKISGPWDQPVVQQLSIEKKIIKK